MSHCECENLTDGGVLHEGWTSTRLGLPGTPDVAEDMAVLKNILLAEKSGVRLHLLHNSTKNAIDAIRQSKSVALGILRRKFRYSILRLPMKNASGITRTQRCILPSITTSCGCSDSRYSRRHD